MAELTPEPPTPATRAKRAPTKRTPKPTAGAAAVERELRARVAELEALVEARTQTIVAMGARLAELQGDAPPALAERLRETERRLAELESTKILRWSAIPRRLYAKLRRVMHG